jgi:hypothetical protein
LIAKATRRGGKGRLIAIAAALRLPFCRRIKAVVKQVHNNPGDVLRE